VIRVIAGRIGAGKTYYAVNHLVSNYYKWDDTLDFWVPKASGLVLITNIEALRLPHVSLDDAIREAGSFEVFFTVEYLRSKYSGQVLILVDEAQRYFHSKFYNRDVFFYFQYHRHLGHDIYLICQSLSFLCKHIVELAEYVVEPARRSLSFVGEFRYRFLVDNQVIGRKTLRPSPRVFALYKSFQGTAKEVEGSPRPLRRYALVFFVLVLLVVLGFKLFFDSFLRGAERKPLGGQPAEARPKSAVPQVSSASSQVSSSMLRVQAQSLARGAFVNCSEVQDGVDSVDSEIVGYYAVYASKDSRVPVRADFVYSRRSSRPLGDAPLEGGRQDKAVRSRFNRGVSRQVSGAESSSEVLGSTAPAGGVEIRDSVGDLVIYGNK
jgi:hypothetical protein